MRLANSYDTLTGLGADVTALVVDPPARNAAFATRWQLPFAIRSDPGGEHYLKALDLWNDAERGGIAKPAIIVVSPAGDIAYRFNSRDFADRPASDDDIIEAVRSLGLDAIQPAEWSPGVAPEEDPSAFRVDLYGTYFRAIRFASMALSGRMKDPEDALEARRMSAMTASFIDAWTQRKAAGG